MTGLLYRYLFTDFWVPVWPNLAASIVCFGTALWRGKVHLRRHHDALKEHISREVHEAVAKKESPL